MRTQNLKILNHMIKQISKHIVTDSLSIGEWQSHTGKHVASGEFIHDENSESIMFLGDTWSVGYDDTRWFSAKVTVPEELANKKVYLQIDFGGEAIVRINGEIKGAVSSDMNSGWVHRDIILFDKLKTGTVLDIEIEAAVCCGGFCDAAMNGAEYMTYSMKTAKLITIDELVESYDFDVKTVSDALNHIVDEPTKQRVFAALDDSLHVLDFDFDDVAFRKSVPAAAAALWEAIEKIPNISNAEVLMTGHSHLDVAWLWTVREIVRKTARTFSNNIELIDRYPGFVFTQSQAVLYDFIKKHYPDLYEKVKEKIRGGQWHITGNAWVEADTNVASGESLIRQLLYGRKFFLEEFGVESEIYWLPDCFGFTWALPQIIKRSGMKYFLTAKLNSNDTNKFPNTLFRWRSHSGDEIVAYLTPGHYQGNYTAGEVCRSWQGNRQNGIVDRSLGLYGYGDGGGGCTYGMLESGKRLEKIPGLPKSRQGSADEFFAAVSTQREELPVWDAEMYYENHRGTYSSQAFVKKYNRKGEILYRNAELFSVLAKTFTDLVYPAEKMEEGWKILLQNQFHDILPGTSIHDVYVDCRKEYAQMTEIGENILRNAAEALNSQISIDEKSIIVWNPLSWAVTAPVEIDIENGEALKFFADNVPALGYKVFKLNEINTKKEGCVSATTSLLENEKLRVEFNKSGVITSIYDKINKRETLAGKGNLLTIFQDKPVHESAWNIEINYNTKFWELEAQAVEVVESSDIRGVVRFTYSFNKSTIIQDVILYANSDRLDFDTKTHWFETEKMLKASFEVAVKNSFASYEIAHGSITRPTHRNTSYDFAKFEVSAHKWADLSEGDYGVSILNDSKYGYDIYGSNIRITLMRSPICPDRTGDHGDNDFVYSYYPHSGSWQTANTVKHAFELNNPPCAFLAEKHEGKISRDEASFISISNENVILDAFKLAENGQGIVLRVYEAKSTRGEVAIKLDMPFTSIVECNMMEVPETAIQTSENGFSFFINPNEVRTFIVSAD